MSLFPRTLLAAAALLALPALADVVVINGDTTGGPTWNRPVGMAPPPPSAVGTNVAYQVTGLSVTLDGSYSFLMERTGGAWDTYLFLYESSFDATQPFVNRIAANDDCNFSLAQSCFDINLTAGTSYFAIATGFSNTDFGPYSLTISGQGNILIDDGTVPEPAGWALALLALGAAGAASRRRAVAR